MDVLLSRVMPVGHFPSIDPPFKTIALAPSGGIFADVIGIELAGTGLHDRRYRRHAGLVDADAKKPGMICSAQRIMAKLKEHGIDAVLVVQKSRRRGWLATNGTATSP